MIKPADVVASTVPQGQRRSKGQKVRLARARLRPVNIFKRKPAEKVDQAELDAQQRYEHRRIRKWTCCCFDIAASLMSVFRQGCVFLPCFDRSVCLAYVCF